jgi:hypothetical protein
MVILVILVSLLVFSGFRSEWLANILPLQWDNDEVWDPGFIHYCISWSLLWCVLCRSEMQVGHWLWRLIGVEVWLWLTVVLLFPHYIMMNHHDITTKMLELRLGSRFKSIGCLEATLWLEKLWLLIAINVQICRMLVIIQMTSFVPQQLKLQGGF